ncbi:hypothetical protein [uncultured Methylobacterium sp.]|uniref:hypothetical protein n=1 Tax=uncultured Methylobacterium sp. TaxID=157278 RepID=UPI0035CAB378
MVTLAISRRVLDRIEARSNIRPSSVPQLWEKPSNAVPPATPETATLHNFETEDKSTCEDGLRAWRMRRVLNRPGQTNWLNIADWNWLLKQSPFKKSPPLDREAAHDLANRLEGGVASGFPPLTLASSLRMRQIRLELGCALVDAFEEYADADLQTVTVIYAGWSYGP